MRKFWYMGLESYPSRYTYQLTAWAEAALKRRGVDYEIIPGEYLDTSGDIVTGQVLDAHGRCYYSLSQTANLVKLLKQGKITKDDVIFFEDMFTPGIESLPYILDQVPEPYKPKVFVRCLAQTIDPDDFTCVWNMSRWMRPYEQMTCNFVTGILASNEEMVMHARTAGWQAPIYNISGLCFDKTEVQSRVPKIKSWKSRSNRVSFASRWDAEKQPDLFMEIALKLKDSFPRIVFSVLSGKPLTSNNPELVKRARELQSQGVLEIWENLNKNSYYELLNDTRVLLNTALQDWTSNTVSEADALGANVLFPSYRSFPEVFANCGDRLYVTWSQEDIESKLLKLLDSPHPKMGEISNWNTNTMDRIIDIVTGQGEQWNRSQSNYRTYLRGNKY